MQEWQDKLLNIGETFVQNRQERNLKTIELAIRITGFAAALAQANIEKPEDFCIAYDRIKTSYFKDPVHRLIASDWFDLIVNHALPNEAERLISRYHHLEKYHWLPSWGLE